MNVIMLIANENTEAAQVTGCSMLTLHRSKADGEDIILELIVRKIQSVPQARPAAPSMLLHLCRGDNSFVSDPVSM